MVGLLAALRPAGRDDHNGSPTGRTYGCPATGPTPVAVVIDGRTAHRVRLTVAELSEP